jgi:hypothetical protein
MLSRLDVAVVLASFFVVAGRAQSPPTAIPAKPAPKKSAPKAKPTAKQAAATENGPCKLGVISAIGERFSVHKFGITVFGNETDEVPIDWGLDDLVFARVRAATGADPTVKKITYSKDAFTPFYHPKSRLFLDAGERLPTVIRNITSRASCERYLVVTTFEGKVPGTNLIVVGIGTYNQGLGSLIRHSHLFANLSFSLLDGRTYEQDHRELANLAARFSASLRITEDPLTKLDNSLFPDPPAAASTSAALRERTRALIEAKIDQALPIYLKEE